MSGNLPVCEIAEEVKLAVKVLNDKLGQDIVVIDLRSENPDAIISCMILASAETDVHMKALYEELYHKLKNICGLLPHHVEGLDYRRWIVADYGEFVVHLFLPEVREYYDLEGLWGDCTFYSADQILNGVIQQQ